MKLILKIAAYGLLAFGCVVGVVCAVLIARDPAAKSPEIFLQLGHSGAVWSVSWSPDGRTLASGSDDYTVKLWDAGSGQLKGTLSGHSGPVLSVSWSPDGRMLATGSGDDTVTLWDAGSGQIKGTFSGNSVLSVSWSPDGRTLAGGSYDHTVKLWDVGSGKLKRTLSGHTGYVSLVSWSPDGRTLATESDDKTVKLWDAGSGQLKRTLSGDSVGISSVSWSPDGRILASGGDSHTVKLWDAGSGQLKGALSGHSGGVSSVSWSPDGRTLASGSSDKTVKLWDAGSGQLKGTLSGHSGFVLSVSWSPDGRTLASGSYDKTVKLWDMRSGQLKGTLSGPSDSVTSVSWSPDGRTLASGSDDKTVKLWDAGSGQLKATLGDDSGFVSSVSWSPDGRTLASGSSDHTVKLWDAGSGQLKATLSGHFDFVSSVSWSPDGRTLASGSFDKTVKLWDAGSGQLKGTLGGHAGFVLSVAWNLDGRTLASGSFDHTFKLWDAESGQLKATLSGHSDTVRSVSWSPDGRTLASGSSDHTVKLWDAGSGQLKGTLSGHSGYVLSVSWSPDGRTLASGSSDHTVKLWDAGSGQLKATLSGHFGGAGSVSWSPDGRTLASGSLDSSIVLWAADTWQNATRLTLLPGNEWIASHSDSALFLSSLQGVGYAAVRFDHQLRPVYPLDYYAERRGNTKTLAGNPALLKPQPIRLVWDNLQNKPFWAGAGGLFYFSSVTTAFLLLRRESATATASKFFRQAGSDSIESTGDRTLLLRSKERGPATAILLDLGTPLLTPFSQAPPRLYLIYKDESPPSAPIQAIRTSHPETVVIPIHYATMARAVANNDSVPVLRELEEPFLVRIDPYDESRPIPDPTGFYGRADLLDRLPAVLRQGQHAGLFGLRKVGKTSLLNQLRTRLSLTPVAWIDCQGYAPVATEIQNAILEQLRQDLVLRKTPEPTEFSQFRDQFLALHDAWTRSGGQGPFVLILDEVDKLFPEREMRDSEKILAEWVALFRILRALAQERKCLSILVATYRPHVNRQNQLSESIGENPMFMSFQENFVGPLSAEDTAKMLSDIGAWKDIRWTPEALDEVYELSGGHPLIARLFASDACEQGSRKQIDLETVRAAAAAIRRSLHNHRIGYYFRESVWKILHPAEQTVLRRVAASRFTNPDSELADATANLENFGLIRPHKDGSWKIHGKLFSQWLDGV